MKRFYLPLLVMLALFVTRCKMDPPDLGGFFDSVDTYQPITKGSTWTYKKTLNSGAPSYEIMTMTGDRTVINNKTYYGVNDKVDSTTNITYFCHNNGDYFIRSSLLGDGITVEYLYLKDDVGIGQTWTAPVTDDGTLGGAPARIVGKVLKRDTTMVLASITFEKVTRSQLLLQYNIGTSDGFQTYQTIDFYTAKGVGIIKIDSDAGELNLNSSTDIVSYKIEK